VERLQFGAGSYRNALLLLHHHLLRHHHLSLQLLLLHLLQLLLLLHLLRQHLHQLRPQWYQDPLLQHFLEHLQATFFHLQYH
jgi:peptidoglycan biosynthesis protein MviN/MurJ (putative lipid II flippase)